VAAAAWTVIVLGAGAWLTKLDGWYFALRKPSWQPPDWLFGPAWTLILGLAGYAFYLAWIMAADPSWAIGLFLVNGVVNMVWSLLFFRLRRPDLALIEVPFLWLSIIAPMIALAALSSTISWLLLPYLLWVSFASFLNLTIVRLNRPFTAR
jgi:tryptophan-rich sensory protein